MHEVTEAINDDKPYIRGVVDGVANDGSALFGISYGSYQLLRSHPETIARHFKGVQDFGYFVYQ
jgi:hypothetical protein